MDIEQVFQTLTLLTYIREVTYLSSGGIPTILSQVFRSFSQYLQENVGYYEIYYDRFLPRCLQFIIH
jgi:type III secretory pathway component EscT